MRITETEDFTKKSTTEQIINCVKRLSKQRIPVLLWVSIPCTGGARWTHVNYKLGNDDTRAKIDEHMSGVHNDRSWGFLVPRLQLLIEMQRL